MCMFFKPRIFGWMITLCFLCFAWVPAASAEDRLFIKGEVNGRPARFVFDTGAGVPLALSRTAARKFGLKIHPPLPPT